MGVARRNRYRLVPRVARSAPPAPGGLSPVMGGAPLRHHGAGAPHGIAGHRGAARVLRSASALRLGPPAPGPQRSAGVLAPSNPNVASSLNLTRPRAARGPGRAPTCPSTASGISTSWFSRRPPRSTSRCGCAPSCRPNASRPGSRAAHPVHDPAEQRPRPAGLPGADRAGPRRGSLHVLPGTRARGSHHHRQSRGGHTRRRRPAPDTDPARQGALRGELKGHAGAVDIPHRRHHGGRENFPGTSPQPSGRDMVLAHQPGVDLNWPRREAEIGPGDSREAPMCRSGGRDRVYAAPDKACAAGSVGATLCPLSRRRCRNWRRSS